MVKRPSRGGGGKVHLPASNINVAPRERFTCLASAYYLSCAHVLRFEVRSLCTAWKTRTRRHARRSLLETAHSAMHVANFQAGDRLFSTGVFGSSESDEGAGQQGV